MSESESESESEAPRASQRSPGGLPGVSQRFPEAPRGSQSLPEASQGLSQAGDCQGTENNRFWKGGVDISSIFMNLPSKRHGSGEHFPQLVGVWLDVLLKSINFTRCF